jgi:hypothetical protein
VTALHEQAVGLSYHGSRQNNFPMNSFFSLVQNQILRIFAPAKTGEIVSARESAFFALFLSSESAQFAQEGGKGKRGAFAVMFMYAFAQHKQRSKPLSIIFLLMGVQTQLLEIRISLGGSASLSRIKRIVLQGLGTKTKTSLLCISFYFLKG